MIEIWKDLHIHKGYNYYGLYKISNKGNIRSLGKGNSYNTNFNKDRLLKKSLNKDGYEYCTLCIDSKKVKHSIHRLVAKEFIANPNNKPQVNHKNGIRYDNRLSNLEWATASENQLHKYYELGFKQKEGFQNKRSIQIGQYTLDGELIKIFGSISIASKEMNICRSNLINICKNKKRYKTAKGYIWRYIKEFNI